MAIRNIQIKKAQVEKHEREKAERNGVKPGAKKLDQKNMTEADIVAQRLENEKSGGGIQKSEAQLVAE